MIGTVVALHVDEPRLHRLLYGWTPKSTDALHRLRAGQIEATIAVAAQLKRLGVAPQHEERTARLFVIGLEAQVHDAIVDDDGPADPSALTELLTAQWMAALQAVDQR